MSSTKSKSQSVKHQKFTPSGDKDEVISKWEVMSSLNNNKIRKLRLIVTNNWLKLMKKMRNGGRICISIEVKQLKWLDFKMHERLKKEFLFIFNFTFFNTSRWQIHEKTNDLI